MAMESQQAGNTLLVRFAGELDLVAAAEFKRVADDLLDRRKARNILINLERASFLDSSFLGALLGRFRRVSQTGGHMGLVRVPSPVRPTLELSGIFRTMPEYSSEAEALSAMESLLQGDSRTGSDRGN